MKNITLILIIFIFSCGISSQKGNWTEKDKERFRDSVNKVEELNLFEDKKKDFIECYLLECEKQYSSFFMADLDLDGCKKLAIKCADKILNNGSVLGYWSEKDKIYFRNDMRDIDIPNIYEKDRQKLIDCYLEKCELNFDSYYMANQNQEKCEKLAIDCYNTL